MSEATLPRPADTDRNLLFGVLALQAALIDNDQFAEVCAAWTPAAATAAATPLRCRLIQRPARSGHGSWYTATGSSANQRCTS